MTHHLRPEELSFAERAPLQVERSIEIDATPAEIWPSVAEAEAWPAWFPGMAVCAYTSDGPAAPGTTRRVHVSGLEVDEVLLAVDAEARYAFTVVSANRPGLRALVEVVTLTPVDGGTRVTYRQALELAPLLRPFAPLLRRRLGAALDGGLAGLRRQVTATPS